MRWADATRRLRLPQADVDRAGSSRAGPRAQAPCGAGSEGAVAWLSLGEARNASIARRSPTAVSLVGLPRGAAVQRRALRPSLVREAARLESEWIGLVLAGV